MFPAFFSLCEAVFRLKDFVLDLDTKVDELNSRIEVLEEDQVEQAEDLRVERTRNDENHNQLEADYQALHSRLEFIEINLDNTSKQQANQDCVQSINLADTNIEVERLQEQTCVLIENCDQLIKIQEKHTWKVENLINNNKRQWRTIETLKDKIKGKYCHLAAEVRIPINQDYRLLNHLNTIAPNPFQWAQDLGSHRNNTGNSLD